MVTSVWATCDLQAMVTPSELLFKDCQWVARLKYFKDVETETYRDFRIFRMSRPRLIETLKFGGCRDRDSSRLRNLEDVETETHRDSKNLRMSRPRPIETHQKVSRPRPRVSLLTGTEQCMLSTPKIDHQKKTNISKSTAPLVMKLDGGLDHMYT